MTGEFAEIAKNDHIILLCIHSLGISEFFVINLNAVMWKLLSHNRISVWMFLWVNVRHTKIDPFYLFPSFGQRNANRWNNLFKFMWIQTKGPCNALNEKIHGKCNPLETNRKKNSPLENKFFQFYKKNSFQTCLCMFICMTTSSTSTLDNSHHSFYFFRMGCAYLLHLCSIVVEIRRNLHKDYMQWSYKRVAIT